MAKVTLTINDDDPAALDITLESDPPFPGPAATDEQKAAQTAAQDMGIHALELLTGLSEGKNESS